MTCCWPPSNVYKANQPPAPAQFPFGLFFFLFVLSFYFFIRPIFFLFSRERERSNFRTDKKKLSIRPLTIYFSNRWNIERHATWLFQMTPTNKSDTIFFFFLLFPPSTRNCVTHFKRKREKQTKEEESQVIFHLLLCCVGGRGRTFEFDWRMDVVVVVVFFLYFSIRYWCVQ